MSFKGVSYKFREFARDDGGSNAPEIMDKYVKLFEGEELEYLIKARQRLLSALREILRKKRNLAER